MNKLVIHPLLVSLLLLVDITTTTANQPNVLVIMVDDLGYGDLSSYGGGDLQTPAIDSIVNDGIKFTNFYANCPVCSPTRASFISGRYPEFVGVPGVIRTYPQDNWGYLQKDIITLGDKMKQGGYSTALIGKWHLGLTDEHWPNNRGFDHFKGWLGDMMDDYYKHERHGINYMRHNQQPIKPKGHATDLFTQWACDYLDAKKGEATPFFLFLSYNAPHTPIQPPQDWLDKVKKRAPNMTAARSKIVALIEHLDDGINTVLRRLSANGQSENTLIIFTSDNGGQVNVGATNGNLRDGKQSMYEGGLRVPTAFKWPGHIEAGLTTDQRAMTMDIYPTVCALAGIPIEHEIDGISIADTLDGDSLDNYERDLYFHRREGNQRYQGLITNAVIRGDWKLLHNSPFAPLELYNLKTDPLEKVNLAAKHPAKFAELAKSLRIQVQRGGAVPWQPPERTSVTP